MKTPDQMYWHLPDAIQALDRGDEINWKVDTEVNDFRAIDYRIIDSRPCDEFSSLDADWGEQDELVNVPRARRPNSARVAELDGSPDGNY